MTWFLLLYIHCINISRSINNKLLRWIELEESCIVESGILLKKRTQISIKCL